MPLFTETDYVIGGADGELGRGMQWQGLSLWVTLRHATTRHIPSTWMPRQPGVLYFLRGLARPTASRCQLMSSTGTALQLRCPLLFPSFEFADLLLGEMHIGEALRHM